MIQPIIGHWNPALDAFMSLQEEIEAARGDIKTDEYAMSLGEWMNLYTDRELDVHPEFQRFFRWTDEQKSRLIESLLLGIPIPPIFVAQTPDGVWDVVDGLQRLSTIFQFAGILLDEDGRQVEPLTLSKTKYLPSLEGKVWQSDNPATSLDPAQRLFLKRTRLTVNIILQESDPKAKYELFQRLNTGGSQLSNQEVRNAILVMVNRDFYLWLQELSQLESFQECVALSDRQLDEQYDMELAIRYLIFSRIEDDRLSPIGDLNNFLTDRIVALAEDGALDRDAVAEDFSSVFEYIQAHLSSDAFRRWDESRQKFSGGFSVSAFEAVSLGLAANLESFPTDEAFTNLVQCLWAEPDFRNHSGSGIRASQRIPHTVPFARQYFRGENQNS